MLIIARHQGLAALGFCGGGKHEKVFYEVGLSHEGHMILEGLYIPKAM